MPKLSKRLETILGMLENCGGLLDVGCDHGYTSIEAVRRGSARRAVAADVAKGPLSAAAAHIKEAGLSGQIETRLSDGLRELLSLPHFPAQEMAENGLHAAHLRRTKFHSLAQEMTEEAHSVHEEKGGLSLILSGIGGSLMCDILRGLPTNGAKDRPEADTGAKVRALLSGMQQLLLSPQSEPALVRHLLTDEYGFAIAQEKMVCDEGKYYVVLDVRPAQKAEPYADEAAYLYGAALIAHPDKTFLEYLGDQERKLAAAREKASKAAGIPHGEDTGECREDAENQPHAVQDAQSDQDSKEAASKGKKQAGRAGTQATLLGGKLEELRRVRETALAQMQAEDCKKADCKAAKDTAAAQEDC